MVAHEDNEIVDQRQHLHHSNQFKSLLCFLVIAVLTHSERRVTGVCEADLMVMFKSSANAPDSETYRSSLIVSQVGTS